MLKAATTATRSPRGTKPVSQAFFSALESVPEASRSAVGKAALAMIRDEMKTRRDKIKAAAAKEKARTPAPVKATSAKAAPAKAAPERPTPAKRTPKPAPAAEANGTAAPKRRGRKPAPEMVEE